MLQGSSLSIWYKYIIILEPFNLTVKQVWMTKTKNDKRAVEEGGEEVGILPTHFVFYPASSPSNLKLALLDKVFQLLWISFRSTQSVPAEADSYFIN